MRRIGTPFVVFFVQFFVLTCWGDVFSITGGNETLLNNYKIALILYSADWCHFSRQFAPVFENVSNEFREQVKTADVIFARVDCDSDGAYCFQQKINKYPTLKTRKYGYTSKTEYRGARTIDAIRSFVQSNLIENYNTTNANKQDIIPLVEALPSAREIIVALFRDLDPSNPHFIYFKRISHIERDSCDFHIMYNVDEETDRMTHKEALTQKISEITILKNASLEAIHTWVKRKCTVPVREITFENAEEITEEGKPLMLLFYDEKSANLKSIYHDLIKQKFADEISKINFVTADGLKFSHPLSHVGRTTRDLPLFCLDSLVHMYLHPEHPESILADENALKTFIADLYSGKLHREFHYGPDPPSLKSADSDAHQKQEISHEHDTTPRESVFKNLRPSYLKYTLLHDEL
ncbi:unnamed protein product [Dicrocoelium dendriticum]|nr:unnamed protein product [Dicrocoelium dendriticum]